MKDKLLRALKWSAYPAFYFLCLVLFGYLTFPIDRLKDRILSEIDKQGKGQKGAPVITIDKLDSYWLTGVEIEGLQVRLPADEPAAPGRGAFGGGFGAGFGGPAIGSAGFGAAASSPAKDSVIEVKEAHARARILPLLIGRVQLDFWASVFGGEVSGTAPAGTTKGDIELAVSDVLLSEVDPLQNLLGVPIDGKVNGALSLSPVDGKMNKASGKLELSIKNIVVSDGKTKIQGLLAMPPAKVDEIVVTGDAEKGVLKITKLSAAGPDIEIEGDGKINVREPWAESSVDLYIKFRFTDAYKGKDSTTKSLLGEPGSQAPGLIEMQVQKLKKARRSDGFYGFHVHGKLKKLDFTPSPTESGSRKGGKADKPDSPSSPPPAAAGTGRKTGGVALPLGASTALQNPDKEAEEKKDEEKKDDGAPGTPERRPALPGAPGVRNIIPGLPVPAPPPPGGEAEPEQPVLAAPPSGDSPPVDTPQPGDGPPPGEAPVEEKPAEEAPR